jgi:hypothetical protein
MNHEALLDAIEKRYAFKLPDVYRYMVQQEWIDTPDYDKYTPLYMGEWLQLQAILEFDFQSVDPDTPANPGLIPFAQSPGGDPYFWYPALMVNGEAIVVYCEFGMYDRIRLDAPSLLGFCYREVLDQLTAGSDANDERFAKELLARWRETWFPLFPREWQQTLAAMPDSAKVEWKRTLKSGHQEQGRAFLHPDERDRIVARDLAFEGIDQEIKL